MQQALHILLVENNDIDQLYLQHLLLQKLHSQIKLHVADTLSEALQAILHFHFDVILVNIGLLNTQRAATLSPLIDISDDIPVIILTDNRDIHLSEQSLLLGAQDYLVKSDLNASILEKTIQTAIVRKEVERKRLENMARQYAAQNYSQVHSFRMNLFRLVHHQIRTPLTIILASSSLMRLKDDLPHPKRSVHVQRIETAGQLIAEFLNNIMAIDYTQSGKLALRPELLKLDDHIGHIIRNFRHDYEVQHRITLNINRIAKRKVYADSIFLGEILKQLLFNAVVYSPPDSKIEVELYYDDVEIVLGVRDQGIGISAEDRNHIFDFGYRGEGAEHYHGLGIGLTIVQEIITLYGGDIDVESQVGGGSYFCVSLPVLDPAIDEKTLSTC